MTDRQTDQTDRQTTLLHLYSNRPHLTGTAMWPNNNNSIPMRVFMVLSSWRGHCESSPGSFDECRLSARWPPTLKRQRTWPVSPPVGCYHPHPPSPFIIITQPESLYSFYCPTKGGRLSRPCCITGRQGVSLVVSLERLH